MSESPSNSKLLRWALEINLWLWVAVLAYVVGYRKVWDRYAVMAAGGFFIAATAQFVSRRMIERARRRR